MALHSNVPTLYFSADSDSFAQLTRSISIITGRTLEDSANIVLNDQLSEVRGVLDAKPIRFSYNANPSPENIEETVEAYEEVFGDYPDKIVIDNVTNVRIGGEENEATGLEHLMDYLHGMSRATESCVVCLHHVRGDYNDIDRPIPLGGVKNQNTRVPEMVLTLFKRHGDGIVPDTLCVSTVKNRGGKADASGRLFVPLEFDGARMRISEPAPPVFEFN